MKKSVLVVVAVLLFGASLLAQSSTYTLRAHIPFDFVVRGDTLPAGDYTVQISSIPPGPMMIFQTSGKKGELVLQVPVQEKWHGAPKLSFQLLGGVYYLVEVSDPRAGVQRVQQGERYQESVRTHGPAQTVAVAAK